MGKEILNFCIDKGILLDRTILNVLEKFEDSALAKNLLERIEYQYKQKIITKSFFENNLDKVYEILLNYGGQSQQTIKLFFESLGLELKDIEHERKTKDEAKSQKKSGVNLIKIYENIPRKIEVGDFVGNFKNRFMAIKNILQERAELENLTSINRIGGNNFFSLIVMVFNKRVTQNNNVILEIEDMTGRITALVTKNKKEVYEKSKDILLDEVIALKCSGNSEIIFVNDIIFPDIKKNEIKKSKTDESAAFISDIHVGSTNFLKSKFLNFISWLNGEVGDDSQKKEALKIKYLFITGDCVDGVGVFPGQESRLEIKDVREQYAVLASMLLKIRSDVKIIMCPGQHDAVRVAEPQPIIGENYGAPLYLIKSLTLVTNPCIVEIGSEVKFKVLMYHGASMHGIINSIEALRLGRSHDSPTDVVKYMLKKRHLAPTHSLTTYTPLKGEDALLIKDVPDIVSTGEMHRPEVADYNGVLLIASSCWQSVTPFEEKVGNNPDPCKVPVLNLKTREVKICDFSGGEDENK